MKFFLIIPMGGKGKRFINSGYKTYKTFLPLDKKITILENIISIFKGINVEVIIIANFKALSDKYGKYFKNRYHLINIPSHDKGPLYSLFLAHKKIEKIVKNNKIFISYSDISWIWKIKEIINRIKNKNIVIFTHTGFHPHLKINKKSDFCKVKGNQIVNISEKKTFTKNYEKELLAIGCYYIKNFSYLKQYFLNNNNFNIKKEFYLTSFIKYFLKLKNKVSNLNIKKFVHLGIPDQYEDYLIWKNYFKNKNIDKKKFKNEKSIMLAAGKGKRVLKINEAKPFLQVHNKPIYNHIFNVLKSKNRVIITNKSFKNRFKDLKVKNIYINKTNSMLETIYKIKNILISNSSYFLTSCDCFGVFDYTNLNKFIKSNKSDLIFFGFKYSYFQKSMGNSHTQLKIKNKRLIDIDVKKKYKDNQLGHAGFFWIKEGSIFNYLQQYKNTQIYRTLGKEPIIDDYFKYLIKKKLITHSYYTLNNYIHVGSEDEYREYIYWENFFIKTT
jgi:bifunctional N-acetylglucosamine-1-phosphate-uridyltransferase/glucosamine-1-phosphate-acetyltransferase GlmU-like protein